jgi:hypothetical protein
VFDILRYTTTKNKMSRVSSFEPNCGEYYEFSDLREAKKEAKKYAKLYNKQILLTHQLEKSYIQDWYRITPEGEIKYDGRINFQS